MNAFVTSIGEVTTEIVVWQLERLGFEVSLLDGVEPWFNKYRRFIDKAHALNKPCLRIDADTIPNRNIIDVWGQFVRSGNSILMTQVNGYDFYRNNVGVISPLLYKPTAIEIIRNNFDKIDKFRPETSAWRLPQINRKTATISNVVGFHGFGQLLADLERHEKNKDLRGQISDFDFEFARKFLDIKK